MHICVLLQDGCHKRLHEFITDIHEIMQPTLRPNTSIVAVSIIPKPNQSRNVLLDMTLNILNSPESIQDLNLKVWPIMITIPLNKEIETCQSKYL